MTKTRTQRRIERIVALEARADDHEERSVRDRLEAARLILEEIEAGSSGRQLALAIGKSHTHVHRMAYVARDLRASRVREPKTAGAFNALYHGHEGAVGFRRAEADYRSLSDGTWRSEPDGNPVATTEQRPHVHRAVCAECGIAM